MTPPHLPKVLCLLSLLPLSAVASDCSLTLEVSERDVPEGAIEGDLTHFNASLPERLANYLSSPELGYTNILINPPRNNKSRFQMGVRYYYPRIHARDRNYVALSLVDMQDPAKPKVLIPQTQEWAGGWFTGPNSRSAIARRMVTNLVKPCQSYNTAE